MTFVHRLLLTLLSAFLLWAAWPAAGLPPLLFTALLPLLIVEDMVQKKKGKRFAFFFYSWLCMLLFNLLTTWWIWYASAGGMILAVFFNSLFMAIILQLFHITKKNLGAIAGYCSLIIYWTAFEFIHLNWELSWPWLSLGNGFATIPSFVQWYEYTGILGGTVWVLGSNCIVAYYINLYLNAPHRIYIKRMALVLLPVLLLPLLASVIIESSYKIKPHPVNIVVVQPNIDPYNEKFSGNSEEQLDKMLNLASKKVNVQTDYVVFPETALPDGMWEEELGRHEHIAALRKFMLPFPKLNIVLGMASNRFYIADSPPTPTARPFRDGGGYYDSYNSALQLASDSKMTIYHKSKLVLGVEKIPFPGLFGIFEKFAINLGGSSGSLGTQDEPGVFSSKTGSIAPVICYESIFGEYITEYIKRGAQAIFIMTNDGWWHDTPGYRQHNQYARLRAVETRRPVARSANTGISCFIDQLGNMQQETSWWVPAVISSTMQFNDEMTFYVRHGDYTGRIAAAGSVLLIILVIVNKVKHRKKEDHA